MTLDTFVASIDSVLKPRGFRRRKLTWNRRNDIGVDVISLQESKAGDSLTVNCGVLATGVYRLCWGKEPPPFADETACTVRCRLGEWTEGREYWWNKSDQQAAHQVSEMVAAEGVRMLERLRSPGAMEQFLIDTKVMEQSYPLPKIYLALLRYQQHDATGARDALERLRSGVPNAWRARIDDVLSRL